MTIPELITSVLDQVRAGFYRNENGTDRTREFNRDRLALMRAISTYGYECKQRGWSFNVEEIRADLGKLLLSMKDKAAEIDYLPLYLNSAIKRHMGQRAEELSAKAKANLQSNKGAGNVGKDGKSKDKNLPAIPATRISETIVAGVKTVEAIRELSPVEILAGVKIAMEAEAKLRREQRKAAKQAKATRLQVIKKPVATPVQTPAKEVQESFL